MATAEQVAALITYVGGRSTEDDAFAEAKYDEATELVTAYAGEDIVSIPATVLSQAVLEVASKLWARKGAANGQVNYGTLDGTPMPTPRDPMVTAYPILDRFLPGGFA